MREQKPIKTLAEALSDVFPNSKELDQQELHKDVQEEKTETDLLFEYLRWKK